MALVIKNLKKNYGAKTIFDGFDYTFNERGIYVLVGPSGRGKTTLLRIISGLDTDYLGKVVTEPAAYAFQEYRLFPVLNALENITNILWEHPSEKQIADAKSLLAFLGFSESVSSSFSAIRFKRR
jgi:ABC-type sugar transport system ATPase subunit